MSKKNKIMDFFSALGRSLMLPIATLAAAGLILGLSSALLKPQIQAALPFLQNSVVIYVLTLIKTITATVFGMIPVLFAICIAFGLAKEEKEIAAFAGFIGYYTFLLSASIIINSGAFNFASLKMSNILGIEKTIEMGAFAGILTGILTSMLHNKFYKIDFPIAIAFYGGKRFVAIVVIGAMTLLGQVMPFVWVPISSGINSLGSLIGSSGHTGVFLFGFLERILIPTGLHHVLNGVFRTTSVGGVYQGVEGCLNIFLQFFDKVDISQLKQFTAFLGQGKMPFMMFGLPAAAYAIYKTSPDNKKPKVKALMVAGVAASIVSGITEPLEFSFMFIAPQLFLFHAIMGGISFGILSLLGVAIGNTGGGIIDFLIYGVLVPGSRWYIVILVGIVFAVIYYMVFKWYFTNKNISIDVNEDVEEEDSSKSSSGKTNLAVKIINGLGGIDNIVAVNNCISRLRVDIKDMSLVNEDLLKKTGSMGIVKPSSTHIHVIYGPKVEKVAKQVKEAMKY
ncbi:PTS trehalose transporter subunit IIBC [Clostridium botulinum]|uniref:PTS system, maltose/glucose-specfic, IIBC component n=1 Tax=Clostridium botulinum (strain Okra / Type B1) TaxID=498213 RepID=B1IEB6_CLOBK|nr:PTS transporter subunit EIIC [Clostridium botulinum]EKX81374.1 PTS system maltose/glucose-specific transporter subunit IIBC [Clostridium botulinum CFSAN001628]ACA45227.1 PTS system, maltose/glucose-specfic, IIBC component [Clostridium botulinum B1 str. Okra]MBD5561906.1 PTS transporter subunit EIIC [Clostridium botulinum]MBD5564954.1 PTS transporter subunit EIIC [Clostridium botulinum]MBD5571168.1 PTS transporter subunit EIIC [Clostridium botulinum]